jgi:hypothetical protein
MCSCVLPIFQLTSKSLRPLLILGFRAGALCHPAGDLLSDRCYEKSLDCVKKLKDSFAKVGAYSSEQKFIRGDPEGVVQWTGEEVETFEEILSDHGDFCAFAGARGVATVLEKTGCEHVKATAQS